MLVKKAFTQGFVDRLIQAGVNQPQQVEQLYNLAVMEKNAATAMDLQMAGLSPDQAQQVMMQLQQAGYTPEDIAALSAQEIMGMLQGQ